MKTLRVQIVVPILALFQFVSELFAPSLSDIQDRHQRYLSEAVDMCDLEYRMRSLDRGRNGMSFDA